MSDKYPTVEGKYGLPMFGNRYHILDKFGYPICKCNAEIWTTCQDEPPNYTPCKRCLQAQKKSEAKIEK